jgi:hypothetical protein
MFRNCTDYQGDKVAENSTAAIQLQTQNVIENGSLPHQVNTKNYKTYPVGFTLFHSFVFSVSTLQQDN